MKDRAAPFSRKHRHVWLTVTGGMIVIMTINVALGWWVFKRNHDETPAAQYQPIPPSIIPLDASPSDSEGAPGDYRLDVDMDATSLPDHVER